MSHPQPYKVVLKLSPVCLHQTTFLASVLALLISLSLNYILSPQLLMDNSYNHFMPHLDIKNEPFVIETGESGVPDAPNSY